jgi:Phasin protein
MMTPEQFAAANQAHLDALVALTCRSFEGVEKLVALNLQAVRATMALTVSAEGRQHPGAYGRQVYDIASSTQSEVAKLVESQMAAAQEKILALVDVAVKNAPAGGEGSLAMVKQAVMTANGALQNVQQAAKQAVSMADASFDALEAMTRQPCAPAAAPPA